MLEVYGDIWTYPADYICLTTNGDINKKGEAVMGRGVALQASQKHDWIKRAVGNLLKTHGNIVIPLHNNYLTFPVKHHWHEKADLLLIYNSALTLRNYALATFKIFVLPRPGCGNGGLQWEQVKPIIEFTLPDNVHVITNQ